MPERLPDLPAARPEVADVVDLALRNRPDAIAAGVTVDELKEALTHVTIYCGTPTGRQAFLAAPTNAAKRNAVESKLRALVRQIMGQAEYHLS